MKEKKKKKFSPKIIKIKLNPEQAVLTYCGMTCPFCGASVS